MPHILKKHGAAALFLFAAFFLFADPPAGQLFTKPSAPAKEDNSGEGSAKEGYVEGQKENGDSRHVRDELTVVFSGESAELDFRKSYLASEAQLYTALYEGLFSYHPFTLEPVPAAASAWELSEDKKTWTFTIRSDAEFSNGDSLRAEDFRASWISMLDPAKESPYSSLYDIISGARDYRLGKNTDPQSVGITAKNDKTLVIKLNDPAAYFPSMLCHHSFSPIHPSMLKNTDWKKPVGNGPYRIKENAGQTLELVKNDHYWDAQNLAINSLTVRLTDDEMEAAQLWNSGEARWVGGNVKIDALSDRGGIVLNPMFATHYYYIRSVAPPLRDYRVRRAMILALPWDKIRKDVYLPAKTLIYPAPGYPELAGLTVTNMDEARKLLEQAGYPKGVGLPELVIRITPGEDAERIAKIMASSWMQLGIPVKIDVVPFNEYFNAMKKPDYDIGSSTWIGDFADPYTFLQMWRRDSNLNDARYNDGDYEALLDKSMAEEGEQRLITLSEAEQLLLDRGTVLPISYTPALNVVDTDELDGWFPNLLDIHPFKYFRFKAYKPLPGVAVNRRTF